MELQMTKDKREDTQQMHKGSYAIYIHTRRERSEKKTSNANILRKKKMHDTRAFIEIIKILK